MFGNRFGKDFGLGFEAMLASNRPSEATSKASVIKYEIEEGPGSFGTPPLPLKFSVLGARERGIQGEPHRPVTPKGVGGLGGLSRYS